MVDTSLSSCLRQAGLNRDQAQEYIRCYSHFAPIALDQEIDLQFSLPESPDEEPYRQTDIVTQFGEVASFKALQDVQLALENGYNAARQTDMYTEENLVSITPAMPHLSILSAFPTEEPTAIVDYEKMISVAGGLEASDSIYFPPVNESRENKEYHETPFISLGTEYEKESLQSLFEKARNPNTKQHQLVRNMREQSSVTSYEQSALSRVNKEARNTALSRQSKLLSALQSYTEPSQEDRLERMVRNI